jgi:hypothetical protein
VVLILIGAGVVAGPEHRFPSAAEVEPTNIA